MKAASFEMHLETAARQLAETWVNAVILMKPDGKGSSPAVTAVRLNR